MSKSKSSQLNVADESIPLWRTAKFIHFLLVLIGASRAVSKENLDFALIIKNAVQFHLRVTNDKKGIDEFIKQAKKFDKQFSFDNSLFCMEHTARAAPGYL